MRDLQDARRFAAQYFQQALSEGLSLGDAEVISKLRFSWYVQVFEIPVTCL